jgi:hypothetical protein
MEMKKTIISLAIIAVLSICMFNGVATARVTKHSTDVHSNYAADVKGNQQTYLVAYLRNNQTAVTMAVNQSTYLHGVLSAGTPPTSAYDTSHGIPNATISVQSMSSDGKTWVTVYSERTLPDTSQTGNNYPGRFIRILTPVVAGVYTYRVTYDGDSQYAPAVSNVVTITATNVAIS